MKLMVTAFAGAMLLGACSDAGDRAEEQVEDTAEASAATAGTAIAALGLTERQLLDADIVDSAGVALGDVTAVLRDGSGKVDRLLVEIEDSNPDKYVHVPVAGLKSVQNGSDWDLATTMTRQQMAALPGVPLGATPGSASPSVK